MRKACESLFGSMWIVCDPQRCWASFVPVNTVSGSLAAHHDDSGALAQHELLIDQLENTAPSTPSVSTPRCSDEEKAGTLPDEGTASGEEVGHSFAGGPPREELMMMSTASLSCVR